MRTNLQHLIFCENVRIMFSSVLSAGTQWQAVKQAKQSSGGVPHLGPGNRLRCIQPGPVE